MNTFKFINGFQLSAESFKEDMSAIRSKLFSLGVCWTDSIHGDFAIGVPFRVVLFTRKNNADFKNPIVKECNGLVLGYNDGWSLLAMPQHAFCTSKISMRKLGDMYTSGYYDVFEVLDATILTLYFYEGKWRISSTKGYDIGDVKMINIMTFMEAIEHLMWTKYKAFKFDKLNVRCSYTIALRHSEYHIFDETKYLANRTKNVPKPGVDMNSYIMLLAVADLDSMTFDTKHVPGVPMQNPIHMKDSTVPTLINYAMSAYDKYAKAHKLQLFKYKPLYGYILRSRNKNVPDEYSTIFIESSLFKVIKRGLYHNNEALRERHYNELALRMLADHITYQYVIVFDQFANLINIMDEQVSSFAKKVLKYIHEGKDTADDGIINDLLNQLKDVNGVTESIIKDTMYAKKNLQYIRDIIE